ncbi:MAG: NTP transferase domain-containing protein [Acidimicrobiia bacterium]
MSIAAIFLAADEGEGFDQPKYLTAIDGVPMIRRVVSDSVPWGVDRRVVVVGPDAEEVVDAIADLEVDIVIDHEWGEGLSAPLRAGLDLVSMDRSVRGCLIARGDQPGIPPAVVESMLSRWEATGADAVVPKYRFARGWPVLVASTWFDHLLSLEGAARLHDVIATKANTIEECHFEYLSPPVLATHEDLRLRTR